MSSHREAPEISKDPVADSTDLYAFVSPDNSGTVTLIANYVPLEGPDGGPNFYEFGNDVQYAINIDNNGDGIADISYLFEFTSILTNPNTFLYNTGPIASLTDPNWNRRQTYKVTKVQYFKHGGPNHITLATGLACPPCNVGPASTPNYASALAAPAIHPLDLEDGRSGQVFAGQRAEGFYVDLGAIFDLGDLRPLQGAQAFFKSAFAGMPGVNSTDSVNVHSIALQVPICELTHDGSTPTNPTGPASVIGVWTTASRRRVRVLGSDGSDTVTGPYVQVSRLGNPLFNEVLVPLARKDYWNSQAPTGDAAFAAGVTKPELGVLLPILYPGAFPNLAAYTKPRADLQAILLTGIPAGVVAPTYSTFTGTVLADLLRLNVAIPPTTSNPSSLGVLGGDIAGFPNGRRVFDDVTTIELRCIAGATIPLVDSTYTPDGAVGAITTGLTGTTGLTQDPADLTARGTEFYLPSFPYLGTPHAGYYAHTADALTK